MRDDDTCVEDLCFLHSAVGLSQINSALGPGTSNKNILPRQESGLGVTPPPPRFGESRVTKEAVFLWSGESLTKTTPAPWLRGECAENGEFLDILTGYESIFPRSFSIEHCGRCRVGFSHHIRRKA